MILIDTDICIELLRGNKKVIEKRKEENDTIAMSFMTVSELYYGAYKSNKPSHNTSLIEEFILTVNVIQSSLRISKRFGNLKSKLQRGGILIEDADIFVAATCLEHCEKLITGNIKHYNRIDELKIENWIR
jgi:tRNA(fMet)-specific endonuclease VapC